MIESSQGRSCFSYSTIQREETFEGETFTNFAVFVAFHEILGHGILWCGKSEQSAKVFTAKIIFFTNSRKFSPLKVSRYMVAVVFCLIQHILEAF